MFPDICDNPDVSDAARQHGLIYFFVSARGLVPWFVYELEIEWSLESEQLTHSWKSFVKTETDYYTLRVPLQQRYDDLHFGMMVWDT